MKLLNELKKWLKKSGNSEAKLAVALGYRDAAPIKQWVRRGRIPTYQQDRVTEIVTKGESNEST
jgi:hypothetical protein